MPGTTTELCAHVRRLTAGEVMPDTIPVWEDGETATEAEMGTIQALLLYEAVSSLRGVAKREQRPAQRRACRLLRSLLAPEQRVELRRRRLLTVTAASGRHYRLDPARGRVAEVEQHGHRFYERRTFCLHPDPEHKLPPADITVAQLCLLLADEGRFRDEANATERHSMLWDGSWQRTVRQSRRDREHQAAVSGREKSNVEA